MRKVVFYDIKKGRRRETKWHPLYIAQAILRDMRSKTSLYRDCAIVDYAGYRTLR